MSQEQDAILQAINGLVDDMKTLAADVKSSKKTQAEEKEELDKFKLRVDAIEASKATRLPATAPLIGDTKTGDGVTSKAGFRSLPLRKALAISPTHPMVRGSESEDLKALHDYNNAVVLKYHMMREKTDHTEAVRQLQNDIDFKTYVALRDKLGYEYKTMEIQGPANTTYGDDKLDFTLLSSTMIDKMRLNLVVAPLFREVILTRPNQAFPTRTADSFGVLGGTSAAAPPPTTLPTTITPGAAYLTAPTFGQKTFSVKHLLCMLGYNDDMLEDSVVPFLPMMQDDVSYFSARTIDRSILDGTDSATTHIDTDVAALAATDFRKAFYGLRSMALNNMVDCGGAPDDADLHAVRAKSGIYGYNPGECAYIMCLKSMYDLVALGAIGAYNALNPPINAPASGLASSGTLASWWGIPIKVSEFVRTDLDGTTGVNDGGGNDTKSVIYFVNTNRFVQGRYGTVAVETTRYAPWLTNVIQLDVRYTFGSWDEHALTAGKFATDAPSPVTMLRNVTV